MCEFSDLNLNITHLTQNEINSLVEFAIERWFWFHRFSCFLHCYFYFYDYFQVGYNNLALAIDFEFPAKKEKQIQFPNKSGFILAHKFSEKLKRHSRQIKILDRVTIKIKDTDLNTYLHHLVGFFNCLVFLIVWETWEKAYFFPFQEKKGIFEIWHCSIESVFEQCASGKSDISFVFVKPIWNRHNYED